MLADLSIYTIRHSNDLRATLANGGRGTYTERKKWVRAKELLDAAKHAGKRVPVIFAPAEDTFHLFAWALLDEVIPEETSSYTFSELRLFNPQPRKSILKKASDGTPLDKHFIRPYAICQTPEYLRKHFPRVAALQPFDRNIDRRDRRSAERLFQDHWPDTAVARAVAENLAASIRAAHAEGDACWVLTMHHHCLRLNVGQVETLTVYRRHARFLFRSPLQLKPDRGIEVDRPKRPVYAAVPVRSGVCSVPVSELPSLPPAIRNAHEAYIQAAASFKRVCPWKQAFSPAVLEYVESTLGKTLPRPSYAEAIAVDDAALEVLEKSHAKSQGFVLDSETRRALEDHAMDAAKQHFRSLGYAVEDHSKDHPYDLRCAGQQGVLYVEVKGTQTNGDGILLTAGEVEFARRHKGEMALFLLHSIDMSQDRGAVSNGTKRLIVPWNVDEGGLKPISFEYEVPTGLDAASSG